MQKEIRKIFFKLEIIPFELVALTLAFTEWKHFSLGVNMLTNSLRISDATKIEFFALNVFQIHKKIWQTWCRTDLSNLLDLLTRWLSISVLTRGFLGI